MHLRDDRRRHVHHLEPSGENVARPCTIGGADRPGRRLGLVLREVVTRGKALARAADDDDTHLRIGIGLAQQFEKSRTQGMRERVALVGSVEGEATHVW